MVSRVFRVAFGTILAMIVVSVTNSLVLGIVTLFITVGFIFLSDESLVCHVS